MSPPDEWVTKSFPDLLRSLIKGPITLSTFTFTDAKWANILYVGQIPEKDIQILEKNQRMHNKVRRTIDGFSEIQFKNELFSITKKR